MVDSLRAGVNNRAHLPQNRPEHVESVQIGKRRSSLGALSKSKPVTKLKSMFEAKGKTYTNVDF